MKSAPRNPRVARITLIAAFFEHYCAHSALRKAQARDQAREPAAHYSDFPSIGSVHDRRIISLRTRESGVAWRPQAGVYIYGSLSRMMGRSRMRCSEFTNAREAKSSHRIP